MAKVNPIPAGYSTVVTYISVKGASDAIAYYKKAFSAEELVRMPMPDGKVGHAELKIGDSILMLTEECEPMGARDPRVIVRSAMLGAAQVSVRAQLAVGGGV